MADITHFGDERTSITKIGPMPPYGNNAYLIKDLGTKTCALVDMPADDGSLAAALQEVGAVQYIFATHWHPDHWTSYDNIRQITNAPVLVGDKEINIPKERIDRRVNDSVEIRLGSTLIKVMHTPGHTPGSICLRLGNAVISGDTLFNGGPGKTFASGNLETLISSIVGKLFPLPAETIVMPGHGETTTINESFAQYHHYAKSPAPPGFFGDVEWLNFPSNEDSN